MSINDKMEITVEQYTKLVKAVKAQRQNRYNLYKMYKEENKIEQANSNFVYYLLFDNVITMIENGSHLDEIAKVFKIDL